MSKNRFLPTALALFLCGLAFDHTRADEPAPVKVTEVPAEFREEHKLDPFYKKYASAGGLPVLSSDKVSDEALIEAVYLIRQMLGEREDILKAMVKNKVRFVVMAPTEMTTDVPEQRDMKPKDYWDQRARGLGGRITSCGEENLLNLKGDRYRTENILVHEFSHAIHRFGIGSLDRKFDSRLQEIYKRAMDNGTWKDTYAATNHSEYWAEGVQAYFDCAAPPARSVHNDINTREKLEKADPDLFALIDEVFKKTKWRYVRYDKREKAENKPTPAADTPAPVKYAPTADELQAAYQRAAQAGRPKGKAAVSACGCHDNRMDKASCNEQWMGYPVGPQYAASSNIDNAAKLKGKLLLIVGELDHNVPPESTLRLADALIKAGKDFDFLMVPGMDHSNGGAYGNRRLQDFFVRHLHGIEPPDRNARGG